MFNKTYLVCQMLGIFLGFSLAASAAPLVQFPTGNTAWTVTITYHTPTGPHRIPQKVDVTQVDNVKRIRITWTDGQTTEQWGIPQLPVYFKEYPNGEVFPVSTASIQAAQERAQIPSDAPDLGWLSPQTLQEKDPITYGDKQCFHYKQSSPDKKSSLEAWIDSKTLQPAALDNGATLLVFAFQKDPPVGPLVPPQKVADEIKYYKHVAGYP